MEQEPPECEYDNARARLEELIRASDDDALLDALDEVIEEERQARDSEMEARHAEECDQWQRDPDAYAEQRYFEAAARYLP